MPLFYFHRRSGSVSCDDPDGSDLPDLAAAREEALAAARDLWAEAIVRNEDLSDSRFVIADPQGKLHLIVPFADALPDGLRTRLGSG